MKNKTVNEKIIKIWDKYFPDANAVYTPLFYDEFKKDAIAFVGMNPSFSESGFRTFLRGTKFESIKPTEFFKWSNIRSNPKFVDACIEVGTHAQENYNQYFKKPTEIGRILDMPVQHLDLFLYMETSQSSFMSKIRDGEKLNAFGLEQLKLFKQVIEKASPKCVVITNAFGSELVREYFKDDLIWNEKKGFHFLTLNGNKVPIFFTSMLSGQRSLDRWSYERLVWHIKQAVKK